tara:strand:- start:802 stop:1494 length:693 start_codon:yes stop_codon:yes gene_type:complete
MIPKIIHQIYWDFGGSNKPPPNEWIKYSKIIKNNHKNWKYILWNEESCFFLLKKYYPWFLKTYLDYQYPIQKADSIRPFILYHYGGIYFDMDFVCLKNIDNFFKKKGVYFLESSTTQGLTNSLMASSKRHPFWQKIIIDMIDNKKKKIYQNHHLYIMQSTGPYLITNSIKSYNGSDLYILPKEIFNPCDICNKNCDNLHNDKIYCYTKNSKSWSKFDTNMLNNLYCLLQI